MDQPLSLKLGSLGVISQCKLQSILALCGDKKDLIIDPSLIKPLERICGVTWLRYASKININTVWSVLLAKELYSVFSVLTN